jgi:hypothetical protein
MLFVAGSIHFSNAQTLEELQSQKAEKEAMLAKEQGEADAIKADVDALSDQILKLSGWQKGLSGLIGFDFNKSNNWASSPNANAQSSSLNIGITGFANKTTDGYFWNNKAIIAKSWQDVDKDSDGDVDNGDLFDNGTVDILNLSSLYGKRLTDKFAVSALGELNTSVENFLEPGTLDFGVGGTWTPIQNLVVVIHPFNYHLVFSGIDGVDSEGALGAKIRADYTHSFPGGINWSSTLTTFVPYKGAEDPKPSLFEYTWLNSLSFDVWKGIGVGVSVGLRNAEFEYDGTQTFYTVGLSYSL